MLPASFVWNGQTLFFTILGLAYFVSSEISLTMGVSVIALGIFGSAYYLISGTPIESTWLQSSRAGAYIGYTLILVYTGRTYFKTVFAKALLLDRARRSENVEEDDERVSVLAARVLLLALAGSAGLVRYNYDDRKALPSAAPSSIGYATLDRHFPVNQSIPDYILVQSPQDLRTPQALFFGQISRWPFCRFSARKSPETHANTGWNRGNHFSVSRV